METRQTVQQRIKSIATRFKKCNYFYMNWAQLNAKIGDLGLTEDEAELQEQERDKFFEAASKKPVICYLLPPTGYFRVKNNGDALTDNPLTEIAFITRSEIDADGEVDDSRIEAMKYLAQLFIREMNKSGLFEPIDREQITYTIITEPRLDDAFVGISITIPLESKPFYLCGETTDFGFK